MTWNVEGLSSKIKDQDVIEYFKKFDVFALTETWYQYIDELENLLIDYSCYFVKATKRAIWGRAMGGCIVYVKSALTQYIERIWTDSPFGVFFRVKKQVFNLHSDCILAFVYLPPDQSPFYESYNEKGVILLEDLMTENELLVNGLPIIIMGDLNARIGQNQSKEFDECLISSGDCDQPFKRTSLDRHINKFGKDLLSMCSTHKLYICNGLLGADKNVGNFTFIGPNGSSVIDYLICSKSVLHYINQFEIGTKTESSHFPIICALESMVEMNIPTQKYKKNKPGKIRYEFDDNSITQYKSNLTLTFTNTFISRFCVRIDSAEHDINDIVFDLDKVLLQCADTCKRTNKYTSRQQPAWFDKACAALKRQKYKNLRIYRNHRTDRNLELYRQSKRQFKAECDKKKSEYQASTLDELIDSIKDSKSFSNKVNSLTKNKPVENSISMEDWKDHFENLFEDATANDLVEGESSSVSDIICEEEQPLDEIQDHIFNSEITNEEILKSVKSLKSGKSAGMNGITPEFFIHGGESILVILNRLFNRIFSSGEYPTSWASSIIVPIHKKGDVNKTDNYRGISLLDVLGKIHSIVINRRLTFYMNIYNIICENQAGFREGYSTIDNAFILQSVITKILSERKGKIYIAFVDFKHAFDTVNRNKLWSVMQENGVKGKLYKSIKSMYGIVKAQVRSNSGLTEPIISKVGLKQGCLISPAMFLLFINELAKEINNSDLKGIQLFPDLVQVLILLFADDVSLISDTVVGLQRLLNKLHSFCLSSGLIVNTSKTKILVCKKGGNLSSKEKWFYGSHRLEVVKKFSYVGLLFSQKISSYEMAAEQSLKAKRAFLAIFSKLYEFGQLPCHVFFNIFNTKIIPILLYGAEIWGNIDQTSVNRLQTYVCRRYMGVNRTSPTAAVLGDCGQYPIKTEYFKRSIKYWLKILQMHEARLVKNVILC